VDPETPLTEARRLVSDNRIRHLRVTECGRLAGIITDRDISVGQTATQHAAR
jgi:CBS domain-containing protein